MLSLKLRIYILNNAKNYLRIKWLGSLPVPSLDASPVFKLECCRFLLLPFSICVLSYFLCFLFFIGVISLSRDFKDVLLNGKDHNVTFNVKDKRFRAHQDILRARSEVFCSMLTHDMIEKNSGVIDVPDCDPVAFEQLLCYVYTGRVEILDESNVFSLYYVADKYHIPHLKEECCNFITNFLTVTNIRRALDLALKHSDATLLESVSNYFFNNLDDILTTAEWELFMKEDPMQANGLLIKTLQKLRGTKA